MARWLRVALVAVVVVVAARATDPSSSHGQGAAQGHTGRQDKSLDPHTPGLEVRRYTGDILP